MTVEPNKQVLAEFDALLSADDLTSLDRLCGADMVNHALADDRPAGLAGTREFLKTMGRHLMTDEGWGELVVVAEGDYIVQYGLRHGRWHGGRSWASTPRPATTAVASLPCTGSKRARSPCGGRCATTSRCSVSSVRCPPTDLRSNSMPTVLARRSSLLGGKDGRGRTRRDWRASDLGGGPWRWGRNGLVAPWRNVEQ